jgi:hypothetical protein
MPGYSGAVYRKNAVRCQFFLSTELLVLFYDVFLRFSVGIAVFEAATNSIHFASHSFWGVPDLDWLLQRTFEQFIRPNVILCGCVCYFADSTSQVPGLNFGATRPSPIFSRGIAASTEDVLRRQLNLVNFSKAPVIASPPQEEGVASEPSVVVPTIIGDGDGDSAAPASSGVLKFLAKSNCMCQK